MQNNAEIVPKVQTDESGLRRNGTCDNQIQRPKF